MFNCRNIIINDQMGVISPPILELNNGCIVILRLNPARINMLSISKSMYIRDILFDIFIRYPLYMNKLCIISERIISHNYFDIKIPHYTQLIRPWQLGLNATGNIYMWLFDIPKLNILSSRKRPDHVKKNRIDMLEFLKIIEVHVINLDNNNNDYITSVNYISKTEALVKLNTGKEYKIPLLHDEDDTFKTILYNWRVDIDKLLPTNFPSYLIPRISKIVEVEGNYHIINLKLTGHR